MVDWGVVCLLAAYCGPIAWAAPRILRWGTKQDSRAEGPKKNFCIPTFPNVGYKQASIIRGLLTRVRGVEIQSLVQY